MRAIHGHALVIAADSPTGILYDTVEQGVRTCEVADARHSVTHGVCLEAVGRMVNRTAYFHISESMIYKRRCPRSCLFSVAYVNVFRARVTQVGRVKSAVVIQFLGITYADCVAGSSLGDDAYPPCHILTEVDDIHSVALWRDSQCRCHFLGSHAWSHLRGEHSCGNISAFGLCQSAVIISGKGPTVYFHTRVIFLAVIFVVGTYRAACGDTPTIVSYQSLLLSVGIFNDDIHSTFGQAEYGSLVRLVLSHGEVASIAQYDTHRHDAVGKGGHIIGVVIYSLAVIRRYRLQHIGGSHFLSVDIEAVKA